MPDDCLFCKILAGEIPADEVASSDQAFAFRDISPQAPSHLLVVPRKHITDFDTASESDAEAIAEVFALGREVARKEGLSPADGGSGYRVVFNVGEDASNTVPHLHMHIIGGRSMTWPPG